jgi:pilus assembly protein Flp/PilA
MATVVANLICRFLRDETAATAVEYGLIAGLIAIVIIASLRCTGSGLSTKFNIIANNLS